MPTYEYRCDSCGEHHEVVQSFRDDPLTVCPACGGPLRKVFGSIGVVFKGSGFYKTDSRSSSKARDGAGRDGKGKDAEKGDKAEKKVSADSSASSGSESKSSGDSAKKTPTPSSATPAKSAAAS